MLGASISKEKVKSLTVPRLFVIFSLLLLLQSCDYFSTVLRVLWRTGVITHEFLGAQPKIQSHMRPVSR